jgi:cellulose biosynthesis protein BcsQ
MLELLFGSFKEAHPVAQLAFLTLCLIFVAAWMFLFLRERSRRLHEHKLNAALKHDLLDCQTELKEIRSEAVRDRATLQQAIPAFQRVIRQNDELHLLIGEVREHNCRLAVQIAAIQQSETNGTGGGENGQPQQARLQMELADLRQRFDELQKIDTDVWIAATAGSAPIPRFVHREKRQTRFVTFLNLKGGVGKTTIAANLAAAYATGVLGDKLRVLAVDLDYQGTLSNLCVEQQLLLDRRSTRRTADRLLDPVTGVDGAWLTELLVPIKGTDRMGMTIVADEHLDQVDFRQQALYAVASSEVRFCHRQLFHQPAVFDQFDLVLFDCPPRLSTSAINALAASDWVVVPTALDPNDIEAVPRTLRWLEKLQTQGHFDFHAKLGGIIINSTYRDGTLEQLTVNERLSLQGLRTTILKFSPTGDVILKHILKDDNNVPQAAAQRMPYGAVNSGREMYRDVALELYLRIKN